MSSGINGQHRSAALSVSAVSHHYGELTVLDDVSLEVAKGELVAIIGPNGAGKTTLLKVVAGALTADRGEVTPEPSGIGWVPQQPAVYGRLTVRENLALFAKLQGVDDPATVIDRMLEQAALQDRADDLVATLSGGNQQRVNIAAGLLGEPEILLLDEPSSSLDPRQRGRMWEFIASLTGAGTAVLFTTHDVAEAERHADRVVVLSAGRVIADLPPDELHALARGRAGDEQADFETSFVALLDASDAGEVPA